ncbi:hypothetical protein KBY31_20290 [Ruegeria pomeroyi]|nr:hypothetical protein [Ruegeria pomeroyi]
MAISMGSTFLGADVGFGSVRTEVGSGGIYRVGDIGIAVSGNRVAGFDDTGVLFGNVEYADASGLGLGNLLPYHVRDNKDGTFSIYYQVRDADPLPVTISNFKVTLDLNGQPTGPAQSLTGLLAITNNTMLDFAADMPNGNILLVPQSESRLYFVSPDGAVITTAEPFPGLGKHGNASVQQHPYDVAFVNNKIFFAWTQTTAGSAIKTQAQIYNMDGTIAVPAFDISAADSSGFGSPGSVQVETLSNGKVVAVWTDASGQETNADQTSVWFRIYNADGSVAVGPTQVNDVTRGRQDTPILFATENGFVIGYSVLTFSAPGLNEGRLKEYDNAGTLLDTKIGIPFGQSGSAVRTDADTAFILSGNLLEVQLPSGGGGTPPIEGTNAGEAVAGTAAAEVINALGGADWITPGGGNDTIDGGDGNDMVSFIDLPDTPGRTNLQFRLDVDLEAGTARSHDGSEQMQLSNVERVTGTIYADYIRGDAGANHLRGAGDYDWFVATTGNDTLDGGTGQDMVTFVEWQNTGANAISDAFSADGAPPTGAQATGVLVDLANPANNTNLASGLTLISIERVTGSGRQDVFYGDGNSNDFRGLGDYDWFVGSAGGRERYFGGDGVDTVTYFMSGEGVTASLRNGARVNGEETGYGSRGDAARDLYFEIENLVGTRFDDRLTGNSGRNQLSGLEGDDFLFGYEDVDYLKGGAGNDTIDGGTGSDYALFDGDRADYTLTRTADNAVTVTGPDGTDSLINVEYFRFDDGDVRIWDLAI